LVIPIAILALAVFGVFFLVLSRRAGTAREVAAKSRSLAILPFRNLREDSTLDYLGFSLQPGSQNQ
jgi:hypothetical protein